MGNRFFSPRNIRFLLYEVFDASSVTQNEYYQGYNKKSLDMVLQAATELAQGLLFPLHREMDENPPEMAGNSVRGHPSMKKIMVEFGNGGWISATTPEALEGQQIPHLIADSCQFIFAAANYSAFAYAVRSLGAAHLLEAFAPKELRDIYLPEILSGRWQGTMALTEPEAGSSLGDITTTAIPTKKGYYRITGQKIFISAGDHDAVDNVVHMLLARIEGALPGVKGVSLFVVPKKRIDESGQLRSNDVVVSGIFHKLGYRGCPTTQLSFGDSDDCHGYLV